MKLPIRTLLELHAALASLDGRQRVIKDGETEKIVVVPYAFSGKTRWNIAKNLSVLKRVNEDYVKARDALINELSGGNGTIDENDTTSIKRMNEELKQVLDTEEDALGLLTFDLAALNLDDNPIAGSVLVMLTPLIADKSAA